MGTYHYVCYDVIPDYNVKQYCPIPHITEIYTITTTCGDV